MDRETIRKIARDLGYTQFQELQEKAFGEEQTYDEKQNLMIIGPTSSGKTLIPRLLYYAQVLEAAQNGEPLPKMLYVVPYRALAAQKVHELQDEFNRVYGTTCTLLCEQSTSEYRQADARIRQAEDIDIAVTINEKAFVFASSDPGFLQKYNMIVFDEIGLLRDENRGIKLDFLMTWIRFLQTNDPDTSLRMIALGTPFYEWSGYARNFGFCMVQAGGRPKLREMPVYINKSTVEYCGWPDGQNKDSFRLLRLLRGSADEGAATLCPALKGTEEGEATCPQMLPCRSVGSREPCSRTGQPCCFPYFITGKGVNRKFGAIAELCRYHLQQNRQILIFWNDRYIVRQLSAYLYRQLSTLLPSAPGSLEDCKKQVLDACTQAVRDNLPEMDETTDAFTEDELVGIFEDENYPAYCAGVGFHSSALPPEARAAVEKDFLGSDPHLRIVCSTETLAYGINSAVDVVIVADMHKNSSGRKEFLKPIEYQNYIGRAGRMTRGKKMEEIVGYVCPLIDAAGPDTGGFDPRDREYLSWNRLKDSGNVLEPLTSTFYSPKGSDYIPFMLLCLIPAATDSPRDCINAESLDQLLQWLPRPEGETSRDLHQMLNYLELHGLIAHKDSSRVWKKGATYYYATDRGKDLKGYTPTRSDYDLLLEALQFAWNPGTHRVDSAALIYRLLDAACLKNHVEALRLSRKIDNRADDVVDETAQTLAERFSYENILPQLAAYGCMEKLRFLLGKIDLRAKACRHNVVLTAAILMWADTANPGILYERFAVNYPLLQALTRELSYLLTIAEHSLYDLEQLPEEERQSQQIELQSLERAIIYGLQAEYYNRLRRFFAGCADPLQTPDLPAASRIEATRVLNELNELQPARARQIRKIVMDCVTLHAATSREETEHAPYGGESPMRTLSALQRYNRTYTGLWRSCVRTILKEMEEEEQQK